MPRNKRPIAFGMILEPLNPADRAFMKNILPGPVRLLYPLLINRPWKIWWVSGQVVREQTHRRCLAGE